MTSNVCAQAIAAVQSCSGTYTKFLSPNDSGETHSHQSGVLLSISSWPIFFEGDAPVSGGNLKRTIDATLQDNMDDHRELKLTYYSKKDEIRVTSWGRGSTFLKPLYTGSLFIAARRDFNHFHFFRLDSDDDINEFLETIGQSPTKTQSVVGKTDNDVSPSLEEMVALKAEELLSKNNDFPSTRDMSTNAQRLEEAVFDHKENIVKDPDQKLVSWVDVEYILFKAVESAMYGERIKKGFHNLDEFVSSANSILNRRKSRAGKGFEYHVEAIFHGNDIKYTPQAVTELHKKPDFIFPSLEAYKTHSFSVDGLTSLAVKTTCKDRWRQIITESDRLSGKPKYLLTLQQGISGNQLREMESENVQLIVPKEYHSQYPQDFRSKIMDVQQFVTLLSEKQAEYKVNRLD